MTHPNKAKGNTYEREIVKDAQDRGYEAVRAWGSDGRALGLTKDVDVLVDIDFKIQCKRMKRMAKYLKPENADVTVIREDYNTTSYFIVPDELFWAMFTYWREGKP